MEPFVKLFQPDRYPNWMLGKDLVPIDHTHPTPSTTPELQIWLQRRRKTKHADKWYRIHMWMFLKMVAIIGYWSEIFDSLTKAKFRCLLCQTFLPPSGALQ